MTPQQVSVIIPALNEAARIEAAIESAWNNDAGEVIVCDGGSSDSTPQLSRARRATVVTAARGRGNQLGAGAQAATGCVLLFLHADNRLSDGCLYAMCQRIDASAQPQQCWGGFKQRIEEPRVLFRLLEWGNAIRIRWRGVPFGDQAVFVTRTLYDRVGGFPSVALMEDVLLSRALRRHSWPMLVDALVHIDARRWTKRGVLRQTARNWGIQLAHCLGVSESHLEKWYR
ncbi:PGL/p-HBAD biosynthesis glycosyltransferase [Stieleria neptunia]|uniref:PGL/p-HBAD biosynthesis glycosyltransferase n=1 Tax=Stieleria neptunia TaxID=2527979 RepID=A0A518HS72_9BACT|nr:TIGR04283 family arsenosugar biosynthesis glycosyltransferase [Stieleria neptunia]QDV43689.1 PGL/p-HBAD biosynthesis glycosyltransferase [Stieleria neptunia]